MQLSAAAGVGSISAVDDCLQQSAIVLLTVALPHLQYIYLYLFIYVYINKCIYIYIYMYTYINVIDTYICIYAYM